MFPSISMFLMWILMLTIQITISFGQSTAPIITIPDGKLRGTINKTEGLNTTYYAYRGIPFAKKPVGDLRFSNPVKNDPWVGTLNATQDKDACTQAGNIGSGSENTVIGSEDCLYINVYTTDVKSSLPVMVWIYGGGFIFGSSSYSDYAPDYILEKNVIYVSFNYRLGVFGFLSTEDSVAPGNWGLKDQVLALKWVKDNIRYFGGDPNRITIFGQSAGSASVSYLLQSNLTKGLYRGAIMQSGVSICLWALTRNARPKAFILGASLGILTLTSQDLINRLRQVDYKRLKGAENNVTIGAFLLDSILAGLPFGVVAEPPSPTAVVTGKSHELLKTGYFNKVPTIIGFTSNEAAAFGSFVGIVQPVVNLYDLDVTRLPPYDLTRNIIKRLLAGIRVKYNYFGNGSIGQQPQQVVKFINADQFVRPIREAVNLISRFANVYYYKFSYEGLLGNPNSSYKGVSHAEELNYLFAKKNSVSKPQDRDIRQKFVTLWTNFAKNGDPTPSGATTPLKDVKWIPNTPKDNTNATKYLSIDTNFTMKTNPNQEDWEFYIDIYRQFGDPPYGTF